MEATNKDDRIKAIKEFILYFVVALVFITIGGVVAIITAQDGIALLEAKKTEYDAVFKQQAELNFQMEDLFRDINNLRTKRRNSSEHKHMQKLISKKRAQMEKEISGPDIDKTKYEIYHIVLDQIKDVQATMDRLDREIKKRESNMEQLEKCRIKYQELTKNNLNKQ